MATASIESPATQPIHLSSNQQRELNARIMKTQTAVNGMEAKIREEQERLASAREIYSAACQRLAEGKNADVEAARNACLRHEAKIEGMKGLLREPKELLDQLKRELSAEVAREDEARVSVEILDEQDTICKSEERALHAIEERDRCIQSITAIIANLRSRTYRTADNKRSAFQAAHKVERKAAGILN